MTFYMPTNEPEDWKKGTAGQDNHWKVGYSTYALAHSWEDAKGFPAEVQAAFTGTIFDGCEFLLGLPEHKVPMPASSRGDSQNDIFVLAKTVSGEIVSMTVEGKVAESFNERLSTWNSGSAVKTERLHGILDIIGLPYDIPDTIRYQLLHRTASAVLEVQRFNAQYALMLVHSFSQTDEHFADYEAFVTLYGTQNIEVGQMVKLTTVHDIDLYTAWVRGDERYLQASEK